MPSSQQKIGLREIIFAFAFIACLTPFVSPPLALLLGVVMANTVGHPFLHLNNRLTQLLLQISVIGLGFSMNVHSALEAGKEGFLFTVISIVCTLVFGLLLGRWMKIERKTAYLVSCGTAICGGSAIAAISPIVKAEEKQISVALGIIFILNALALFIFPVLGHWLELSQKQFGVWAAIAIHDTSSVVGAASRFGSEALQVATTVKLARALWIIPMALLTTLLFKGKGSIRIPYFIGFYLLAMVLNTYIPQLSGLSPSIVSVSKAGLTLTLFLIGSGLNVNTLKAVGFQPLLQGIILWIFISCAALYAVLRFV